MVAQMTIRIVQIGMLTIALVLVLSGISEALLQFPAHNLLCSSKSCWVVETFRRHFGSWAGYLLAAMDVVGLIILRQLYRVISNRSKVGRISDASSANHPNHGD